MSSGQAIQHAPSSMHASFQLISARATARCRPKSPTVTVSMPLLGFPFVALAGLVMLLHPYSRGVQGPSIYPLPNESLR